MPNPKAPDAPAKPAAAGQKSGGRKPWKKKSPIDVVLEQESKLRAEVTELEEQIKAKRTQLQKFEQFRKMMDTSG